MAKQIIILEKIDRYPAIKYIFWIQIPSAIQFYFADPNAFSGYKSATAQEIQDIKDGKVVEVQGILNFNAGTPPTQAEVKQMLISEYTKASDRTIGKANKFDFYGKYWDGTAWF